MTAESLDQRYLEFHGRTGKVFERFPELEPLRYFIFRDLVVQRRSATALDHAKRWVRPLIRRRSRDGAPYRRSRVLMWLESNREVIREAVLPVCSALRQGGADVQLVSQCAGTFKALAPRWSRAAWDALRDVEPAVTERGAGLFYQSAVVVGGLFEEIDRLLDAVKPQTVVTASTQLAGGAALVSAARKRGIRTVVLQHGMLQPLYVPVVADVMCTWGDASSETLAELCVDRRRLPALGSPRHDAMGRCSADRSARAAMLRTRALDDRLTLAFFSNGNDLLRNGIAPRECARWLESTAARFAGRLNIIVRLHPNEDGSLYHDCPHLIVTKHEPEYAVLLEGCDAVASLCSTALYEALLYGKPVLQLYGDGWPDLATNWKCGLATRIASEAALQDVIASWLTHGIQSQQRDIPVERVFANHGRAAQRVAEFLLAQTH